MIPKIKNFYEQENTVELDGFYLEIFENSLK